MSIITYCRDVFVKFPVLLSTYLLVTVGSNLVSVFAVVSLAPVADILLNPEMEEVSPITTKMIFVLESIGLSASLISFLCAFLFCQTIRNASQILLNYSIFKIKAVVISSFVTETFDDFFKARWIFFTGNNQGTLLNTFLVELSKAANTFTSISLLFAHGLQFVCYISVPLYIAWEVTFIGALAAGLISIPFLKLGKLNYRLGRDKAVQGNVATDLLQELLSNAKIILSFAKQDQSLQKLKTTYESLLRTGVKAQTLSFSTPLLYEPLSILVVIVILLGFREYGISLANMAVSLYALRAAMGMVGTIISYRNDVLNHFPSVEQVMRLRGEAQQVGQRLGGRVLEGFRESIILKEVEFAYPGGKPVVQGINMKLAKGSMVALVGSSGSGKSTLIDIVMGLHEPASGSIEIDGVDLAAYDLNSYRRRIGYVPQDSTLFDSTIRENLLWAKTDATDEQIETACDKANAVEFIKETPEMYETLVGTRGVRLSGGQRQRIALARAILCNPDLLILDEATSSLDSHSERLIQKSIENIARETTVLVIAHRLSTIANADYIYVMDKGIIVEEGPYRELVDSKSYFNKMVQLQDLELVE